MLTNQMKEKAENFAETLRPIYAEISNRANQWRATYTKYYKKHNEATFCPNWGEALPLWEDAHELELKADSERANLWKAIRYLADLVAEFLGVYWWELKDRRGFESLAELLNELNPTPKDHHPRRVDVGIYGNGGELLNEKAKSWRGLEVVISCRGAVGVDLKKWIYLNGSQLNQYKATAPKFHTLGEYKKGIAKAEQLKKKAEEIASQQLEILREIGEAERLEHIAINNTK